MRCLVVADLHYSLPQFDWLLSAAPQFDLVIFAGDALDIGSAVDFRAQILVVKKYLARLSGLTRVILCSGNHDLDERNADGEKIARWIGDVRDLGAAGEFADKLGRQALLRRCRARAMDRASPALDGDLRPCAPVAVHSGWIVVRPAGPDLGVQHRPSAGPATHAY